MSEVVVTLPDGADAAKPEAGTDIELTPEQELADLRKLVAEKDHAVIRAVVSTSELQQELETSRAEAVALKAQLEIVRDQPQAAIQAAMNAEVLKLNAKFNHARKTLEREHSKVRSELISLRAHSQQLQHQLETEKKGRQIEAARASGKIASLEQDLAVAYGEKSASGRAESRERAIRIRLSAAAVAAAIVVALAVGWSQMSAQPNPSASASPVPERSPVLTPAPSKSQPFIPAQFPASPHEFQTALGRLNNALANFSEERPEDVLAGVRHRMSASDPSVCAFDWNNGQPALLYAGQKKSVSLASTLTRCAQAVEMVRMR